MQDIIYNILLYLPVKDIGKCSLVNKVFHNATRSEVLWHKLYMKKFYDTGIFKINYYETYKLHILLQGFCRKVSYDDSYIKLYNDKMVNLIWKTIQILPKEIDILDNLQILFAPLCRLMIIPQTLGNLINLKKLTLYSNQLNSIPKELCNLSNLEELLLGFNSLKFIPKELGNLKKLEKLDLENNDLTIIPTELGNLNKLNTLNIRCNLLDSIPTEVGRLTNLKYIYLTYNPLISIPKQFCELDNLCIIRADNKIKNMIPLEFKNILLDDTDCFKKQR
jgi:Leucine-rich repeat (LRR) protein